ncbi:MAG: glycosyltransferase [Bacteroidetes bacterium]|nr:glycosyltransferase [Bacteroidota bacterium]
MKLFVVLSRVPYPLDKGDKLRAFQFIRFLSEYHDIYLYCLNENSLHPDALNQLKPYCKEIYLFNLSKTSIFINLIKAFFNGKPFQVGYFFNSKAKKQINSLIESIQPDHIFCQLARMAEYVKDFNIPKTLDYQDVFSYGIKRRMQNETVYLLPVLKSEYKRMLRYENEIFGYFNHKLIISETDRDLIPHPDNKDIHVLPNGVDTSYYQPIDTEKEFDILFTGNMSYPPNIDACQFLVNEILPLVHKRIPGAKVMLAGSSPHFLVKKLESDYVVVTGWVDDMRLSYAKAKVFIAPMRIGTGLQNKLLEAMAMQLPCITTPLANDALKANEGSEIFVNLSAQWLAKNICDLLENTELSDKIALNGYDFVIQNFNWKKNIKVLHQIISKTE